MLCLLPGALPTRITLDEQLLQLNESATFDRQWRWCFLYVSRVTHCELSYYPQQQDAQPITARRVKTRTTSLGKTNIAKHMQRTERSRVHTSSSEALRSPYLMFSRIVSFSSTVSWGTTARCLLRDSCCSSPTSSPYSTRPSNTVALENSG